MAEVVTLVNVEPTHLLCIFNWQLYCWLFGHFRTPTAKTNQLYACPLHVHEQLLSVFAQTLKT